MNEPDYYAKNGLSPLQAFEQGLLSKEQYVGFCKGNVIKYTIRAGEKHDDPLLDIVKAMDYLHHLHKALKKEEDDTDNVLDIKLKEVQESIDEFKKSFPETTGTLDSSLEYEVEDIGYTYKDYKPPVLDKNTYKKREFPKPDERLRHNESLCGAKKYNLISRIKGKIGDAF